MKRTKLDDRVLPNYTRGEEIFNMVTHIVGGAFGIAVLVLCIVFGAIRDNGYGIVSGIIYGVSMILLYTMSSIYHGLSPNTKGKKVFQIMDHCSIFVLIAGTYTPVVLCSIRPIDPFWGWTIFAVVWIFTIIGIVLNAIDIESNAKFSMICYLVMGWCIVVKINLLPSLLGWTGFILLLSGGIVYTIGAVLYGIGKKRKYVHSVFHLCVVLGNLLHMLCVLLYVI